MRDGLRSLTARGRAFLAAGATAVACAIVLGQSALVRVGVLLVVLPLIAAFLIGRSRYRLALQRVVTPQLVAAGQPAQVSLTLTNEGRMPTGTVLLEDRLPYTLGTRPRFVIDGMHHGWHHEVSYSVRSDVRGRFDLGPMTVRVGDPFGLVELGRAFTTTVPLTVTPRVIPLPPIGLGGDWTGSGDNRPRAFAAGSAEDVTVRDYRQGDDLRRVHWRSSARTGQLMVRREEQPWQSRATVLIDNRLVAHRGTGAASSFEAAVTAAASVAVHLTQRGFAVRLATAEGEDLSTAWHDRSSAQNIAPLLESLAVLTLTQRRDLATDWLGEGTQSGAIIAILGGLTSDDAPTLSRLRHHSATPVAMALDVEAWLHSETDSPTHEGLLTSIGWRPVLLRPGTSLAAAWKEVGAAAARSAGGRPTAPAVRSGAVRR